MIIFFANYKLCSRLNAYYTNFMLTVTMPAIVNILITIIPICLVSKRTSKPLKSTHFPLPRNIAFIFEPPCIFLSHFLGASVEIVLRDGWRDTSDSRGESSLQVPWMISPVTGQSDRKGSTHSYWICRCSASCEALVQPSLFSVPWRGSITAPSIG